MGGLLGEGRKRGRSLVTKSEPPEAHHMSTFQKGGGQKHLACPPLSHTNEAGRLHLCSHCSLLPGSRPGDPRSRGLGSRTRHEDRGVLEVKAGGPVKAWNGNEAAMSGLGEQKPGSPCVGGAGDDGMAGKGLPQSIPVRALRR